MGYYARIKKETEAWELMDRIFTYPKKWREHRAEIEEFIGSQMERNLYFDTNTLTLERVPEKWADQFKKNCIPRKAKTKSKINKEWQEFCKKLGLEVVSVHEFSFKYALHFLGCSYHWMNDEYYVSSEKAENNPFDRLDWADQLTESEFLRIRADFLEKRESAGESA